MTGARVSLLCLIATLLACGAVAASDPVTLEGEFVWKRADGDRTGGLKAVFSPTGEGEWNVAFHFDWEDGPHTYRGTAKGELSSGELRGEVENDNEERKAKFRFHGTVADGSFTGTHGHVQEDGSLYDTGTLSLGPAN